MSATLAAAIAGGAIAAGSGIGNTLINYGVNKDLAHDARVFNANEAQKQRNWEQYMASTQYQRAMSDMKAAGINPASLSGVNAQPSSVPSGASASSSAPSFGSSTFTGLSDIVNSAVKGVFAKDRNAARLLASEVRDNARHGFRMEELQEAHDLKSQLQAYKHDLAYEAATARQADRLELLARKAAIRDDARVDEYIRKNRLYEEKRKEDYKHDIALEKWKLEHGHKSY